MNDLFSITLILKFVLQQRFCLTEQLHFLIETDIKNISLERVKRFLFSLKKQSFLVFSKVYGHWSITHKGRRYLLDSVSNRPRLVNRLSFNKSEPIVNDLLYHDYLVTDVRLVLMRYLGDRYIRWISLAEIENFEHKPTDKSIRWKRNRHKLKGFFSYPDGFLEFESKEGDVITVWIELERSKKTLSRYLKLFDKNINPPFEIFEPPLEEKDDWGRIEGDLIEADLFFYIVAPFSPALTPLIKARRQWALDSLMMDRWKSINPIECQKVKEVFERFYPLVRDWESTLYDDSDKYYGAEMAYYYSLLPLLPNFEYDNFNSIVFYNWSGVRRPYYETRFYLENSEYRDIVNEFDPVFDFMGRFGKDENNQKYSMEWIDRYMKPSN